MTIDEAETLIAEWHALVDTTNIQSDKDRLDRARFAERLANALLDLCNKLKRAQQFCKWLSEDSKKYPGTDAGNAARRLLADLDLP